MIKPLHTLSRQEVREMAQAAAERGDPLDHANVFAPGTANHDHFNTDYRQHANALAGVA